MNIVSLIKRELKDWFEFFIRYIPGKVGFFIRELYFKKRISYPFKNNRFESGIIIDYPRNIKFGSNSYFGIDCKIYASEYSNIKIGSNVTFNSNVMINARGKGKIKRKGILSYIYSLQFWIKWNTKFFFRKIFPNYK